MAERFSRSASDYRPVSARRRLLIGLLAVATAVAVMWLLLERPGAVFPPRPAASPPAPCPPGQLSGCVGGKTELLRPAEAPASAAR